MIIFRFISNIIIGLILCVLQGIGSIHIGWFFATLPFWIDLAIQIAYLVWLFIYSLFEELTKSLRGL